jgi:hypothetical protein
LPLISTKKNVFARQEQISGFPTLYVVVSIVVSDFEVRGLFDIEMPVPSQGHYGFHSFPVVD